ncbi:MAG: GNAT family N-acetyltransferase, partial [Phycisphaerales bacterium]|nr:GNAT family N-acetyltransferase [Phycisphaerales bacterium]
QRLIVPALIRPASEADCTRIAEITGEAITTGFAHFGSVPDSPEDVVAHWRRDREVYPWFVAECTGDHGRGVVGYSRATQWKPRAAYDWTCESAVYIASASHGRGIGRMLYEHLFAELELRGFRCVLGGVTLPNPASERLHEAMGMSIVGTFPAVGFKMGAWRGVRYYVKVLGDGSPPTRSPSA